MPTIMRDAVISFPMLGDLQLDPPCCFTLFGKTIYFYGVIIALGMILAALYCARRAPEFGLTSENLYDILIWVIPLSVIGARIYFVAFEWDQFAGDFGKMIAVWEGGLAIYGGVIAGLLTVIIWSRVKKIPMFAVADLMSLGLLIGQAVGRFGTAGVVVGVGVAEGMAVRHGLLQGADDHDVARDFRLRGAGQHNGSRIVAVGNDLLHIWYGLDLSLLIHLAGHSHKSQQA